MKQINPSEIKPGMTIRWETQMEIKSTTECNGVGGVLISGDNRITEYLASDAKVTVLSEPAPVQPEEPTEFGARVVADGHEFLLSHGGRRSWKARLDGKRYAWTDLCDMGSVVVIDATPSWTVPETPEVPERIEVWPEWDKHLRAYEWRDHDGRPWIYSRTHGRWYNFSRTAISKLVTDEPKFGPWTRATDA